LDIRKEKTEFWGTLNKLGRTRPLVWINEIPWHEFGNCPELALRCKDKFLRDVERGLRCELYQWNHFACDMVVEPVIYSNIVGGPTSSYAGDRVRRYLSDFISRTRNNCCEIILKDITTVLGHPEKLDRWAKTAMELVESEA
jgi:hypothetical protein